MDDSPETKKPRSMINTNIQDYYLDIPNRGSSNRIANCNNSIIKFTKLPDFDFDSQVIWPNKNSYVLHPHLRRIITLNEEDPLLTTSRSLNARLHTPQMSSRCSRRNIVTISEDEDKRKDVLKSDKSFQRRKIESKPILTKPQKPGGSDIGPSSTRNYSRVTSSFTSSKSKLDTKPSAKSTALSSSKINNESKHIRNTKTSSPTSRSSISNRNLKVQKPDSRAHICKDRDVSSSSRNTNVPKKSLSSVRKNMQPSTHDIKSDISEKSREKRLLCNFSPVNKVSRNTIITVPLDKGVKVSPVDCGTEVEQNVFQKDMCVGSDQLPEKVDVITGSDNGPVQQKHIDVQTEHFLKSRFDSLDIPNACLLLKDKIDESNEGIYKLCSKSLPNLQVPALQITPHKESSISAATVSDSMSYIIGRATVTYTTKQKIDFHVVSNKEETVCSTSSSPAPYPMTVVSVLKKEIDSNKKSDKMHLKDDTKKKRVKANLEHTGHGNELQSINCSNGFDSVKLVKPSELISTIRLNNGLLQNDYITEQFQRELNFIDSFFESLQYLENCSMSNKSFTDTSVEHWVTQSGFHVNGPEYDRLFSKFENDVNNDDTETMASRSLCLLNLLIRDEQRRAKNLLFVLKMREDALRDFTKSQILWLENKKRRDNIDIPSLKKKQRGALLKLQHECGEMQRMRKALLALSEKRKVALMKTKKNIELKLNNNVSVEQILLGKKKLKRKSNCDRSALPLKCFDLSSSGCEDSTSSLAKSESPLVLLNPEPTPVDINIKSAEKSIQTGESLISPIQVSESATMTAENFVTVNGGYLNILFQNLSLPEIFSSDKSYEVDEAALRSIVNSTNNSNIVRENDILEKFVDQIKNCDPEKSSTPSTAHSLVEEFDRYYKGLVEEDQSSIDSPEQSTASETCIGSVEETTQPKESLIVISKESISTVLTELKDSSEQAAVSVDVDTLTNEIAVSSTAVQSADDKETIATQAGPLPVPAGAAAVTDVSSGPNTPSLVAVKTTDPITELSSSLPAQEASLVHSEAEELRRQQLAIEREIKALEQQQCQLLVMREIPDKPPPPYIAPAEVRAPKLPQMFVADGNIEQKVKEILNDRSAKVEPTDALDVFVQDFCQETILKYQKDYGDKPWDASNVLPQKPTLIQDKLVQKTSCELKEVLAGPVPPVLISGVGTRRSDHIDDILFTEWRCHEREWTSHHSDDASLKNQIFETILQRVLNKTIEEYKKIVHSDGHVSDGD